MENIAFFMNQISVNQFAILGKEVPNEDITMDLSIQFKTDKENRCIAMVLLVKYLKDADLLLMLELLCGFKVKPEDWDACINGDNLVFPQKFLRHIAVHTVGTARGVLYCKTENTPFNVFILPPINVDKMINQDLIVPLH
jgi:hypothetical protein